MDSSIVVGGSGAPQRVGSGVRSNAALAAFIFIPFVTGYFISYYFRAVNAVLSPRFAAELGLDATQIGVITSAYFLTAAAVQIPVGAAFDRWGPRAVQIPCLLIAAVGALLSARADSYVMLLLGRSLIGIGVASSLMAGLKAIVLWMPRHQIATMNGLFIAIGSTGALCASVPTELALTWLSWRELFDRLAVLCLISSLAVAILAPRGGGSDLRLSRRPAPGLVSVVTDLRFWRLAPLSASTIGAAWAFQGLWAAPWLSDVGRLEQSTIAWHLLAMATALSLGALGFGVLIRTMKRIGVETSAILGSAGTVFILAEIGVALNLPVSPLLTWCLIGAFGAGTVISYSLTAEWFAQELIGRANGALNVLHFAFAFAFQGIFGWAISHWPRDGGGHYPADAYKAVLLLTITLQLLALLWFLTPIDAPKADGSKSSRLPSWRGAIAALTGMSLAFVLWQQLMEDTAWQATAFAQQFETGSRLIGEAMLAQFSLK